MPIELPVQDVVGVNGGVVVGMGLCTGELVDVLVAEAGRLAL